jgi:hypothetical protein
MPPISRARERRVQAANGNPHSSVVKQRLPHSRLIWHSLYVQNCHRCSCLYTGALFLLPCRVRAWIARSTTRRKRTAIPTPASGQSPLMKMHLSNKASKPAHADIVGGSKASPDWCPTQTQTRLPRHDRSFLFHSSHAAPCPGAPASFAALQRHFPTVSRTGAGCGFDPYKHVSPLLAPSLLHSTSSSTGDINSSWARAFFLSIIQYPSFVCLSLQLIIIFFSSRFSTSRRHD